MGKSVLIINKYYHPIIGGVETVVRQYAQMLRDSGFDVTVLSAKKDFSVVSDFSREDGIRVIRCASLGTFFSMPVSFSLLIYLILNHRRYDFLHFHEPFPIGSLAGLMAFKKRQRIIVTWHCDIVKQKALKNAVGIFQGLLLAKADFISITSPAMAKRSAMIRRFNGKARLLPLSIDLGKYVDAGGESPKGVERNGYILHLGRLSYYKGITVLLEAYKLSKKEMPLVIAGQGTDAQSVRDFIDVNPGLKVTFIDRFVDESEKMHLLANCAFFVLPSIHETEAFAIIQLEAMAFGKPVLNTNLPTGVPWVSLDGETGITVAPGDPRSMARAIDSLSASSPLREKYGKAARARVETCFDDSRIKEGLLALYGSPDRKSAG